MMRKVWLEERKEFDNEERGEIDKRDLLGWVRDFRVRKRGEERERI